MEHAVTLVSQPDAAKRTGVKLNTLRHWLKAGLVAKHAGGKVDLEEVARLTAQRMAEHTARVEKAGDKVEMDLRLKQAKLDKLVLETAILNRKYIPVVQVASDVAKLVQECKSRLLAIPNQFDPEIAGLIREAVIEALSEFHEGKVMEPHES